MCELFHCSRAANSAVLEPLLRYSPSLFINSGPTHTTKKDIFSATTTSRPMSPPPTKEIAQHLCGRRCGRQPPLPVLRAHPMRGTPCSPHQKDSVLTTSEVLRAHPIRCTLCSPHLKYSVLTPSDVLRAHPI